MSAPSFVSAHLTENYQEYRKYCFSLYKGRSYAEDLLHEFCVSLLTIPAQKAQQYFEQGKLKFICIMMIKRMFFRRGRKSNPLNETCTPWEVDFSLFENIGEDHLTDLVKRTDRETDLDLLIEVISKKLASTDDWYNTAVLLHNKGWTLGVDPDTGHRILKGTRRGPQSINKISKEAKLSRQQLSESCKQAAFEIRRYVDEGGSI